MTKIIAIIGGGYAGMEAYFQITDKKLKDTNIILISKSNFFYHNVASPRALVESKISSEICIPLDRIVKEKNQRFIHGELCFI